MKSGWTWFVQASTAALAIATMVLLVERRPRIARYTCALQATLVVVGWGLAMDGHFVLPDVSVMSSVAHEPALPVFAVTFACGALLLVPAFWYLLRVFKLGRKPIDSE